jgi:hypothetical protein
MMATKTEKITKYLEANKHRNDRTVKTEAEELFNVQIFMDSPSPERGEYSHYFVFMTTQKNPRIFGRAFVFWKIDAISYEFIKEELRKDKYAESVQIHDML